MKFGRKDGLYIGGFGGVNHGCVEGVVHAECVGVELAEAGHDEVF